MILSRKDFVTHFEKLLGQINNNSAIWIPEMGLAEFRSQWFVCVKPVLGCQWHFTKSDYWNWCDKNLKGRIRCYSSDNVQQEEWWGFTDKRDIPLWILKWS